MITPAEWAQFETDLSTFNTEVGQQPVVWNHVSINLPRYNEGEVKTYDVRSLLCVVSYNAFRTWPIGAETETGVIDKEYCHLLLNNSYLTEQGWLTANKNLAFNPNGDTFIVNGIEYESMGDTPVSQNQNTTLYTIVILKRKTTNTGIPIRP